ncbi:MAG: TerC family protein [Caldilineaceae bacterium]
MDFLTAESIVALLTLVALEIVLGIDNVIFIAILSSKLPQEQQARARSTGIGLAVITRILLLLSITWIMQLTQPLFNIFGNDISGRDLILLVGGLFLIGKSTYEIHEKLEASDHTGAAKVAASFASVIFQIVLIDIVFSLDSVITAVGISGELIVMVPAVVVAAAMMLFFAGPISEFVERHPTMKILALALFDPHRLPARPRRMATRVGGRTPPQELRLLRHVLQLLRRADQPAIARQIPTGEAAQSPIDGGGEGWGGA